ncbi:hypothetical protein TTRE_0000833901 [Trichuris trichiura]|uniref:Integrator complex subunit 1 INTS2-binding domain-containing protein n=1 Tax=Trichuris trichiura TaxID=36087 RepID=A0A077ZHX3_TRITR|nr:hypothetical protein TTRE_0000833901 [Trichuris trichiura]
MVEYLFMKDDCLRIMKALFREVVRGVLKNEFPLPVFCQSFLDAASKAFKPESPLKERIYRCLEDMIGIAVFLRIPSSREGHATSRKDASLWEPVHQDIRRALHEIVVWLKNSVFRTFRLSKEDYLRRQENYHRLLFLDRQECYIGKDGWPTESEKNFLLRTVAESGVLEKTLLELVTVNQFGDLPFNFAVGVELVDQLIRRAYFNPFNGKVNLEVTKDVVGALLKACIYRRPEGIVLPPRYSPVPMAICSLYWMAWIDLIILSSTNPQTVGAALWRSYPTGHYLMEMVIVEQFTFPPFTVVSGEQTAASFWNIEEEAVETERREILELEVYLAAASTKQVITEENSLLLPQLMKYDPKGLARCPPTPVIDQISLLSKQLGLRYKFCASRSPDFLLDIIERQGALQSLPWLSDIIKQNDDPFNLLPIECCCEFLINHPEAMLDDADVNEASFNGSTVLSVGIQNGFGSAQIQYRDRLRQMASSVTEILRESRENCAQAKSAILYFLNRLHAESYVDRTLVLLLLEKVLHRDGTGKPFENLWNVTPGLLEQFEWLFVSLVELPYFSQIKERVIEILLKCFEFETDPRRLHAYIHYAYLHLEDTTLETCCKALAKGLSRRCQTLIRLIPYRASHNDVLVEKTHNVLLDLFARYLRSTLHNPVKDEEIARENELQIQFHNNQSSITMADVFDFTAYLLIREPSVEGYANYNFIFSLILGKNECKIPKFCHNANGQPVEFLSSQLLSVFMVSSNEILVDRALIGLKMSEVHRCLRQFGLPISNANRLLGKLDDFVAVRGSIDDQTSFKLHQFVLFYRSNGALGGDAFLRSSGSPAEPSGITISDPLITSSVAMVVVDSSLEQSRSNICIPALLDELSLGKRDGALSDLRGQIHELLVRLINEISTERQKPLSHCCIDWLRSWQPSVKRKTSTVPLENRSQITSLFCLLSKLKDKTLREAFSAIVRRLAATNPAMDIWFASLSLNVFTLLDVLLKVCGS